MKTARNAFLALCLFTVIANRTAAQTVAPQTFDDKVFAVAPVRRFPADSRAFAGLSPHDQHDVLACRDVLMGLLKSPQTGGDGLRYLAPDFASQYRTTGDVLASLMVRETSLMAAGISGFDFVDDRTGIQLRFFMVAFSEGKTVVSEAAAVFKKTRSQWRVAGFE